MVEMDYPPKYYGDLFMGKIVPIPEQKFNGIYMRNVDYLIRHDQVQLQFTLWGKLVGYMNRRRLEIEGLRADHSEEALDMIAREQLLLL